MNHQMYQRIEHATYSLNTYISLVKYGRQKYIIPIRVRTERDKGFISHGFGTRLDSDKAVIEQKTP